MPLALDPWQLLGLVVEVEVDSGDMILLGDEEDEDLVVGNWCGGSNLPNSVGSTYSYSLHESGNKIVTEHKSNQTGKGNVKFKL